MKKVLCSIVFTSVVVIANAHSSTLATVMRQSLMKTINLRFYTNNLERPVITTSVTDTKKMIWNSNTNYEYLFLSNCKIDFILSTNQTFLFN